MIPDIRGIKVQIKTKRLVKNMGSWEPRLGWVKKMQKISAGEWKRM